MRSSRSSSSTWTSSWIPLDPELGVNTPFTIDVIPEFGSVLVFDAATYVSLPEETYVTLKP